MISNAGLTLNLTTGPFFEFLESVNLSSSLFVTGRTGLSLLKSHPSFDMLNTVLVPPGEPDLTALSKVNLDYVGPFENLISVGGGSAIDFGKGVLLLLDFPDVLWSALNDPAPFHSFSSSSSTISHTAVPTRIGSGAEVSSSAIFRREKKKVAIVANALRPFRIHWDPSLVDNSVRDLAAGLLDMLGHSVESLLSRFSNPLADVFALESISWVVDIYRMETFTVELGSTKHFYSSILAGVCQDSQLVSLPHALSHNVDSRLPHGCLVGNFLRQFLSSSRELGLPAFTALKDKVQVFGLNYEDLEEALNFFVEICNEVNGVSGFEELTEDEVASSLADPCMRLTSLSKEEALAIASNLGKPLRGI